MANVDVVTIKNLQENENALFARISLSNKEKDLLLIEEGYEGLLIKDGLLEKPLKTGTYKIKNLFKKEVVKEVLIYQKTLKSSILWGTKEQLSFFDSSANHTLKLGANGALEFQIANIRKFYLQFGKGAQVFTLQDLKNLILTNFIFFLQSEIVAYMEKEDLSFADFEANKEKIANGVKHQLSLRLEDVYGLRISSFAISGVIIPKEDLKILKKSKEKIIEKEEEFENVLKAKNISPDEYQNIFKENNQEQKTELIEANQNQDYQPKEFIERELEEGAEEEPEQELQEALLL